MMIIIVGQIKEGDHVAVLEAMKMQNVLKSPRSGIVKTVHAEVSSYLPRALASYVSHSFPPRPVNI